MYAVDDDLTIWVMTLPKASGAGRHVHAVFASEPLAEEWAAANPRTCAGAQWEPFALHVPVTAGDDRPWGWLMDRIEAQRERLRSTAVIPKRQEAP